MTDKPDPMQRTLTREFLRTRDSDMPGAHPADRAAVQFVRSWHRLPVLHESLWYRGVNIGELLEWELIPALIPILTGNDGAVAE